MDLTLDQALQKGVEAHKAGKVQEADRYYTAILKDNPKHPDANHNMGVLAVGVGKVEQALPFFKTALEVNPNIAPYWLSYIDALIKLNRLADAKAVLDQAKSKGAKGDAFEKIEQRVGTLPAESSNTQEPPKGQQQSLMNLYTQGQYQETLTQASQLLKQFPNDISLHNISGAAYQGLGKLDEAIETYKKAIVIKPDYAEAYNNMGNALKDKGNLEKAIEAYKKALAIKPDNPDLNNNLGVTLQELGKLDEAIEAYKKALATKPDNPDYNNNLGVTLQEHGKLDEAIEAYTTALSSKPDFAEAYSNMGLTLQEQGKLDEAIEAYTKALAIKHDYAEAYNNLGVTLKEQGTLDKAIEAYTKALSFKSDFAEAYSNMGLVLNDQGKIDEAMEAYTKALSIKPDSAEAYSNIGVTLKEQGKLDKAIGAYDKALSLKPDYAEAHRNLSLIKKYTIDDVQFLQVQEYYDREDMSDDDKCHLSFTLAKMYDDIGKLDKAYIHLSKGNALRKKLLGYSINQDRLLFTKLKDTQPKLQKSSLAIKQEATEPIPIFIVGMPRSGTTLVEQIISSHSQVTGAGELEYVSQLGLNLCVDPKAINTAAISTFRKMYLSKLSKISNGRRIVTDKIPQNFRFLPLISAALPEAKIIHLQRNSRATCWSNYKQYFVQDGLGYSYDLKDMVAYYNLYKNLMELWQSEYGDRIYNLNYENLTTDQENETKKLIKHLELTWEEACLSPHTNKRSVRTASQQQVRQKVYRGSSDAWLKYEPYLNGAFDSLQS